MSFEECNGLEVANDVEIGFVKCARLPGSVRYGIRSKSKVPKPGSRRQAESRTRGAMDTFSIQAIHQDEQAAVQIGSETFGIGRFGGSLPYSLNKNKRWELIDNLDTYVDADPELQTARIEREENRRHGRAFVKPLSDGDATSSSSDPEEQESPFHVVTITRDFDTRFKERAQRRKFWDAHDLHRSVDDDNEIDYVFKKTRKGRVAVPEAHPGKPRHTPQPTEAELALSKKFFAVTVDAARSKGQRCVTAHSKHRRCPCCYTAPAKPRVHKYRYADSD